MLQPRRATGVIAVACSLLLASCEESTESSATIQLTAAQAAQLQSRLALAVEGHPDVAWLADSASIVLTAGATADSVAIASDLGPTVFYAVGLQRRFTSASNSFSTFDFLAFNDPSNPTHFIVVSGYSSTAGPVAPQSVTGSFGAPTLSLAVNAHLFDLAGGSLRAWRAATGSASFASGEPGAECPGFSTEGVSCARSELQASFTIAVADEQNADFGEPRSASLSSVAVPGVALTFAPPGS